MWAYHEAGATLFLIQRKIFYREDVIIPWDNNYVNADMDMKWVLHPDGFRALLHPEDFRALSVNSDAYPDGVGKNHDTIILRIRGRNFCHQIAVKAALAQTARQSRYRPVRYQRG